MANGQLEFRGRITPARVAAECVEDLFSLAYRPLVSAILGAGGRIRKQSAIMQPDRVRIGCWDDNWMVVAQLSHPATASAQVLRR